jgi:hypothetical protein
MGDDCYEVEIADPSALSGASMVDLVRTLARVLPVRVVGVIGAEGAGPAFGNRFPRESLAEFAVEDFMRVASDVVQFDWGDFFLMEESGRLSGTHLDTPYQEIIPKVLAMVRAVDDTFFSVYTANEEAVSALVAAYSNAVCRRADIHDLKFPY